MCFIGIDLAGVADFKLPQTEEETPHKYLVELVDAHLLCSVFALDMEGRADGRALKTILPQINPRKLVRTLSVYCVHLSN